MDWAYTETDGRTDRQTGAMNQDVPAYHLCICWRECSVPSVSTQCSEGLDLRWS